MSGWGEKGPLSHKPVYDPIIQALSGLATVQAGSFLIANSNERRIYSYTADEVGQGTTFTVELPLAPAEEIAERRSA